MYKKILSPLIELAAIGVGLAIATNLVSDDVKALLQEKLALHFPGYPNIYRYTIWAFIVFLLLCYILFKLSIEQKKTAKTLTKDDRDNLLDNLGYVYDNILRAKLHNDLKHQIDVVLKYSKEGTEDNYVQENFVLGYEEKELEGFSALYEDLHERIIRLLILGEPGSGKSTLLLQFAKELVNKAKIDDKIGIPILLNLSSWTDEYNSIEDWLSKNLTGLSGIFRLSERYASVLAHSKKLVLLLDGFDEISELYRQHFFTHLRAYLKQLDLNDKISTQLIICSRIDEYVQINANAPVQASVTIQAIDAGKVKTLLQNIASHNSLRKNTAEMRLRDIEENPQLTNLLNTAFYLNISLNIHNASLINYQTQAAILNTYINEQLEKLFIHYNKNTLLKTLNWISDSQVKHNLGLKFELTDINIKWSKYRLLFAIISSQITAAFVAFIIYKLAPLNNYEYSINIATYGIPSVYVLYSSYTGFYSFLNSPYKLTYKKITKAKIKDNVLMGIVVAVGTTFPYIYQYINSGNEMAMTIKQMSVFCILYGFFFTLFFIFKSSEGLPFNKTPYSRFKLSIKSAFYYVLFIGLPILAFVTYAGIFSLYSLIIIFPLALIIPVMYFSDIMDYVMVFILLKIEYKFPFRLVTFLNCIADNSALIEKEGAKWRYKHVLIQEWFMKNKYIVR